MEKVVAEDEKLVYTVKEIARLLGISPATAYESCNRGELPTFKVGRRVLVPRIAFQRFLASKTEEFERRQKEKSHAGY